MRNPHCTQADTQLDAKGSIAVGWRLPAEAKKLRTTFAQARCVASEVERRANSSALFLSKRPTAPARRALNVAR